MLELVFLWIYGLFKMISKVTIMYGSQQHKKGTYNRMMILTIIVIIIMITAQSFIYNQLSINFTFQSSHTTNIFLPYPMMTLISRSLSLSIYNSMLFINLFNTFCHRHFNGVTVYHDEPPPALVHAVYSELSSIHSAGANQLIKRFVFSSVLNGHFRSSRRSFFCCG